MYTKKLHLLSSSNGQAFMLPKRKGPALAQEPGCGAIGCYSAGGVHRSLLPPEEPLLPPLSGAGVTTSGVFSRVAEAA